MNWISTRSRCPWTRRRTAPRRSATRPGWCPDCRPSRGRAGPARSSAARCSHLIVVASWSAAVRAFEFEEVFSRSLSPIQKISVRVRLPMTAGMGSHAGGPPSFFMLSRQASTRSAGAGRQQRRRRHGRHRRVRPPVVHRGEPEHVAQQGREADRGQDRPRDGLREQPLAGPALGKLAGGGCPGQRDAARRHDRAAARLDRVDQQRVVREQLVDPQVDPEQALERRSAPRRARARPPPTRPCRCRARGRASARPIARKHRPSFALIGAVVARTAASRSNRRGRPSPPGRQAPITTRTNASASDARSVHDRRGNVMTLIHWSRTKLSVHRPARSNVFRAAVVYAVPVRPGGPGDAHLPVREGDWPAGRAGRAFPALRPSRRPPEAG